MGHGRVSVVLGTQNGLGAIKQICEEVKRGDAIQSAARSAALLEQGRLSGSEIYGALCQLFQIDRFFRREGMRVTMSVIGNHIRSELPLLLQAFGYASADIDFIPLEEINNLNFDALIYVPLDVVQNRQVEQLARLSLMQPRVRHVSFAMLPKWNHTQLMALRETWEWLDPRQQAKCLSFTQELIQHNGGHFDKDQHISPAAPVNNDITPAPVIITRSQKMKEVLALVDAVADTDSTVLITGASGTGKELIAQRIHCHSHRRMQRMMAVNCGAIPGDLLESELFGHVKGAFTGAISNRPGRFQAADRGTLFLDEIGEMGGNLQVKLLRVLQTKKYEPVGSTQSKNADVRIVAATNRDLENEVLEGRFREDLFYRLNVIPIHIPGLKERREDIQLLVEYFVKKFNADKSRRVTGVSRASLRALVAYDWPGNVRELENLMERMVILKNSGMIDVMDFPEKYRRVSLSEIEYDDLMNLSKSTLKTAMPMSQIAMTSSVTAQTSQQSPSMDEIMGEEAMIKNTFSKGIIEQSASAPGATTASNEMAQAQSHAESAVQGVSIEDGGSLSVEQVIRLAADRMNFPVEGIDFNSIVDQFENILILQALERTGWNRNRAAGLLRLNRTTLVEKLKKKQLVPPMRFEENFAGGNA